jgi:hypothetical protein
MKRRLLQILLGVVALVGVFLIGFVCGQVSEAAYRFRNETGWWVALPAMVEAVQSGRWERKIVVNEVIKHLETEQRFLKNPLSIYPHSSQSYEMMPHRVAWIDRTIQDLQRQKESSEPEGTVPSSRADAEQGPVNLTVRPRR